MVSTASELASHPSPRRVEIVYDVPETDDRWVLAEENTLEGYGRTFKTILASAKPGSRDVAVEMGRRGIRHLARARAFESLRSFAGEVVMSTRDPALIGRKPTRA
jgi:hypothetical protein